MTLLFDEGIPHGDPWGEVGRNCIIVTVAALWGTDLTRIKRIDVWRLPTGMGAVRPLCRAGRTSEWRGWRGRPVAHRG
ncbi:protein of unknown function [Burkholderia multivorans]